ncbi:MULTISPECIES: transglutaminase domain-containing protein [Clostridium]|uniref:Transglutaminase-like domain-containing protein n=1 Tax=Clostridium frigoriphilum TaxID=443253 RepID=A0ABU7UU64_9CLOT|nr:transglutaminase-like domain-containing protein [Clostridium sp. DSM 17811]MBU3101912.1 transglutaminase-like domain-containing protein [Clostridium sp. DSM 17811]
MAKSIKKILAKLLMATIVASSTLTGIASAQTTQSYKDDPMFGVGVEKLIYDNYKKGIMTTSITLNEQTDLMDWNLDADIYGMVWFNDDIRLSFKQTDTGTVIKFTVQKADDFACENSPQLESIANTIASKANTFSTDREKIAYINDEVVSMVSYNHGTRDVIDGSAYGALVNHQAVCEGYAKAVQLLCSKVGIPCVKAYGDNHMWNEVYVEGKWLMVDATWNDTGNNRKIFLIPGYKQSDTGLDEFSIVHHIQSNSGNAYMKKEQEILAPGSTGQTYNFDISKHLETTDTIPVVTPPVDTNISVMPILSNSVSIANNASGSAVVVTLNNSAFKQGDVVNVYTNVLIDNVLGKGTVDISKPTTTINTVDRVYKNGDSLFMTVQSVGKHESKAVKYVFTADNITSPVVTPPIVVITPVTTTTTITNSVDLAKVVSGSVVIGNKAYDLSYANDASNVDKISKDIIGGGKVYVKDFSGNWLDNSTGKTIDISSIKLAS